MLYAPFGVEVIEFCVGSLRTVREFTDESLAKLEHPASRAFLGAILDTVRRFLDRWEGAHTPTPPWAPSLGNDPRRSARDSDELPAFFSDLGELRAKMRSFILAIGTIEPKATAPNLAASWGEPGDVGR